MILKYLLHAQASGSQLLMADFALVSSRVTKKVTIASKRGAKGTTSNDHSQGQHSSLSASVQIRKRCPSGQTYPLSQGLLALASTG